MTEMQGEGVEGPDGGSASDAVDVEPEDASAEIDSELSAVPDPATGHPAVTEVLSSLARLDDLPVEDHVGVFEQAHESLRRALSEARDTGA